MAKKIAIGKLSEEVASILDKYADDIADGTDVAAQKAATQCVKDIKANARSVLNVHDYDKQWTKKQTQKARGKSQYTVYCKKPGLPHLLENGHAKVGGGRVAGRPHIAPAEETAVESFQTAVEELIQHAGS